MERAILTVDQKAKRLSVIAREIAPCTACDLSRSRTKTVPGDGAPGAEILFIGEAPGYHEDQQGKPFVGAAGQFLNELLASIGLKRSDVFITNVVKCRPPNNRDPQPDEIQACAHFLQSQIDTIQPKLIVTLGRFSMAKFFPGQTISKIHGQPRQCESITVLPMFHPAAALHQPAFRRLIEEDFKKIPALLAEIASADARRASAAEKAESERPKEPPKPDAATQLTLF